jgi:cytochrome P450
MAETAADLRFAPDDLGFIADPYPVYAHLREHAPVLYDEATDHYLIARYEDVNALLRDRRFGRTYLHRATHAETASAACTPTSSRAGSNVRITIPAGTRGAGGAPSSSIGIIQNVRT